MHIEKSATMSADLLAWARMPTGGQNANGGPKCQRRAKIPPSLKSLAVLKKKISIKLALAIAIAIAITLIRVPAIAAVRKISSAE